MPDLENTESFKLKIMTVFLWQAKQLLWKKFIILFKGY